MKTIRTKKTGRRTWINILLILVFTMISISGVNLHLAAKNGIEKNVWGLDYGNWYALHIISAILTLVFIFIHIYQHKKWYKAFFKDFSENKKRKKGTILLTVIFALVVITGMIDWINSVPNSSLGLVHAKIGQLMIIFILVHICKRLPFIKDSFHKKGQEVKGISHTNISSYNGCGVCTSVCSRWVFEMKNLTDKGVDNLNFIGKQKVKYKGRYRSFPTNTNLCIHCGLCMKERSENAIKFMI